MASSLTTLSGRCLCGAISWVLPECRVGQVLVCHCSECRRVSGSTSIPFAAVPRQSLLSQIQNAPSLSKIALSNAATRNFCQRCSSMIYMEYKSDPNTVWLPIGTFDDFDPQLIQIPRDSQIFCESKMTVTDALYQLPLEENYGTYKIDVCSGAPFDELPSWRDAKESTDTTKTQKSNG